MSKVIYAFDHKTVISFECPSCGHKNKDVRCFASPREHSYEWSIYTTKCEKCDEEIVAKE